MCLVGRVAAHQLRLGGHGKNRDAYPHRSRDLQKPLRLLGALYLPLVLLLLACTCEAAKPPPSAVYKLVQRINASTAQAAIKSSIAAAHTHRTDAVDALPEYRAAQRTVEQPYFGLSTATPTPDGFSTPSRRNV